MSRPCPLPEPEKRGQPGGPGRFVISVLIMAGVAVTAGSSAGSGPVARIAAPDGEAAPVPQEAVTASADGGTVPSVGLPDGFSALPQNDFPLPPLPAPRVPPAGGATAGIPVTVLAAYRRAAGTQAAAAPGCHLPMELLAGIGKVESGHARSGAVDVSGTLYSPILGPVLNGAGATAAISDTDGGALDGNPVWDRAVGPMQFIPGTWRRWASDGNADGRADPGNIYDAALASGRYLCAGGRDLATEAGLAAGILSYNNSSAYLRLVRSWMDSYRTGVGTVPDGGNVVPAVLAAPLAPAVPVAPVAPVPPVPPVVPGAPVAPAPPQPVPTAPVRPGPAPTPTAQPSPTPGVPPVVPAPGRVDPALPQCAPGGLLGGLFGLVGGLLGGDGGGPDGECVPPEPAP
jgi:hypothetical protein